MTRKVPKPYGKKTSIVTKFVKFRNVTEKESPKKARGVFSKKGGANRNQAHLGLPGCSSRRRLLLEEATWLAWANWLASSSPIFL